MTYETKYASLEDIAPELVELDQYVKDQPVIPSDADTFPYSPDIPSQYQFTEMPLQTDEPAQQDPLINTMVTPLTKGQLTGTVNVDGFIYSAKDKNGITGVTTYLVQISTKKQISDEFVVSTNNYSAWCGEDIAEDTAVVFKKRGFTTKTVPIVVLHQDPDVYMQPGIPVATILLVVAAVAIYRKQTKKVGAFTTSDVWPIILIAGGFLAFDLVKQILETLGLWKSKETKNLDAEAQDPSSAWSTTYWQTIKPPDKPWTYAITTSVADAYAKEIYDAMGFFDDCEECAKAVFRRLKTKANLSYLAYIFDKKYNYDLLDFVRGGNWPKDRLSDSDVNEINEYISRLPNY
jgi:hypothetical protein